MNISLVLMSVRIWGPMHPRLLFAGVPSSHDLSVPSACAYLPLVQCIILIPLSPRAPHMLAGEASGFPPVSVRGGFLGCSNKQPPHLWLHKAKACFSLLPHVRLSPTGGSTPHRPDSGAQANRSYSTESLASHIGQQFANFSISCHTTYYSSVTHRKV